MKSKTDVASATFVKRSSETGSLLWFHKRRYHGGLIYLCIFCDSKFSAKSTLRGHMRSTLFATRKTLAWFVMGRSPESLATEKMQRYTLLATERTYALLVNGSSEAVVLCEFTDFAIQGV